MPSHCVFSCQGKRMSLREQNTVASAVLFFHFVLAYWLDPEQDD